MAYTASFNQPRNLPVTYGQPDYTNTSTCILVLVRSYCMIPSPVSIVRTYIRTIGCTAIKSDRVLGKVSSRMVTHRIYKAKYTKWKVGIFGRRKGSKRAHLTVLVVCKRSIGYNRLRYTDTRNSYPGQCTTFVYDIMCPYHTKLQESQAKGITGSLPRRLSNAKVSYLERRHACVSYGNMP